MLDMVYLNQAYVYRGSGGCDGVAVIVPGPMVEIEPQWLIRIYSVVFLLIVLSWS
jgi:hypothetical protein